MFCNCFYGLKKIRAFAFAPRRQCSIRNSKRLIRHNKALVKEKFHPQPIALRTSPIGCVKRKEPRFNFGNGKTTDRTGKIFTKCKTLRFPFAWGGFQNCNPIGKIKCSAKAIGEPCFHTFTHDDPVYHHIYVMAKFLVQCGWFIQLIKSTIHFDTLETLLAQLQKLFTVFAFAIPNYWGKKIGTGALLHLHDTIHHILYLLRLNRQTGRGTEGRAGARKKKAKVVVYLSHRSDR